MIRMPEIHIVIKTKRKGKQFTGRDKDGRKAVNLRWPSCLRDSGAWAPRGMT